MTRDPHSIRSAASKVSFLGAAKSGTGDLWRMRVTTVALVPLAVAFVWIVLRLVGKSEAGVRAELHHPISAMIMLLFITASVWHMKIGMQSIIDDYVHNHRLREWALIANILFSIVVGFACAYSILKIGFLPQNAVLVFSYGNQTF
jgi:succinate dehydrogenase / fumarate reductase, membrane anchor subunit